MAEAETIKAVAEKVGKSISDIREELQALFREEKQLRPSLPDEALRVRAERRLLLRYRREMLSRAKWFSGVIIGDTGIMDAIQRQRRVALDMYVRDPNRAIELGLVDAKGNPLDTRKTLPSGAPNKRWGQPLPEHLYIRTVYGMGKAEEGDTPVSLFRMILGERNEKYALDVPMFSPVRFRANIANTQNIQGVLCLNAATVTKFEPLGRELPIYELLKKVPNRVEFTQLEAWNREKQNVPAARRIFISEADVIDVRELDSGNTMLLLSDATSEVVVPAFFPSHIKIDFGPESRVVVFGRVDSRPRPNFQGRQVQGLVINGLGVYPIEEYKVPLERKAKTETATPPEEEVQTEEGMLW